MGEVGEGGFEGGDGDVGVRGEGGEDGGDYVFVFFGLERAGGVEKAAAGGEVSEGGGEDLALAGGLTRKVRGNEAELDFGVAAEGASAAAGNIAEYEVI